MIGRTRRGASRAAAALFVAGCSFGTIGCAAGSTGPGAPVSPGGSSNGGTEGPGPAAAPAPEGSTTVGCDASRPADPDPGRDPDPGGDPDLVVGPFSLPGAAHGIRTYGGTPAAPGPDGLSYYKIGVQVVYGSTATVSIGAKRARSPVSAPRTAGTADTPR